LKAGWEWMGHGVFQRTLKAVPDERAVIAEAKAAVEKFTGKKVHGWLGPALQETFDTPDVLKELDFDYVCEWCLDDVPSWMTTKHGPFLSIPYSLESNDVVISALEKHTAQEFSERIARTVDCFEHEKKQGPRIATLPLHPHLMGVPHRIGYLEQTLDMLLDRKNTIFMSGQQIADWFVAENPAA
jgi:allantoinase